MTKTNETTKKYRTAIAAAFAAPFHAERPSGCGRVYVCLSIDGKDVKHVKAACKALGLIFQPKAHYGLTNAIYVGYDNASGRLLGKGEAVAQALNALGVKAYMEACAD